MATDRPIWMCEMCLNKALKDDPFEVTDTINQMAVLVKKLNNVTTIKSKENPVLARRRPRASLQTRRRIRE